METGSKRQLLKRIASLVSENKDLKEKQRALSEAHNRLADEVEKYREWIEKAKAEQVDPDRRTFHRTKFDTVTILYVDIQGLSGLVAADADATEYMDKLDEFVLRFNEIVEKHQLVKLQSIGDSFICAGGIPEKNITNPMTVTLAALEMLTTVKADLQRDD